MRTVIAAVAAALAASAVIAPAVAAPEQKTELADQGKPVDSLLLRYGFDATWVVDSQTILLRDTYRDHYVVTMDQPCEWLELDRSFFFFPKLADRVRAARFYEVRDNAHENCTISKIEKVSSETAQGLREKLAARG